MNKPLNDWTASAEDLILLARTDLLAANPDDHTLHPDVAIPIYLRAIARVLLARELRATESHDSVQTS